MYPNKEEQIEFVQLSLEEAMHVVEVGEAIERLKKNKDFKLVIHEGYFRDEASRLVMLTADSTLSAEQKEATWGAIRGIGEFRSYLMAKAQQAVVAEKEILDYKETLGELRSEDAEGAE